MPHLWNAEFLFFCLCPLGCLLYCIMAPVWTSIDEDPTADLYPFSCGTPQETSYIVVSICCVNFHDVVHWISTVFLGMQWTSENAEAFMSSGCSSSWGCLNSPLWNKSLIVRFITCECSATNYNFFRVSMKKCYFNGFLVMFKWSPEDPNFRENGQHLRQH